MHNAPGKRIDFAKVRSLIPMNDVLTLLKWEPSGINGPQLRGACPLPNCPTTSRRTFAVHLEKQAWHCFACGHHGNQLDLWTLITGHDLYHATIHLCQRIGKPVPYRSVSEIRNSPNSHRNPPAGPR
jgi:DNA primase